MTENTRKKIDWANKIFIGVFALIVIGAVYGSWWMGESNKQRLAMRKKTVCPSLLSIGRSARDTLIIMKNEPLCNEYILDNLK